MEPQRCPVCEGNHLETRGVTTRNYQVAQLVKRPIEVVEYQQVRRFCCQCGEQVSGELPELVIPGQDVSANLQAMLVWLGHYGHLSSEYRLRLVVGLTHFLGRKMLESYSGQGNYVKTLEMARTLGNKGIIPFRRKSLWPSIFKPIFYCFFV